MSEIAPNSTITDTGLKQIVVAGPNPVWQASDLETLAELKPILRDGKRHFVRAEAVRRRLEEEDRALTELYVASWREALKADPISDITADKISQRFEQLHRELDEQRIVPGQLARAGLGNLVATVVVQKLESDAFTLRDGEARLWSVDVSKLPEIKNLRIVAEELERRFPEMPQSNNGQVAYRATIGDVQVWARCTTLTVFARRSGALLHLATHGFDAEGMMLVFARRTVETAPKNEVIEWPKLPAGALKITSGAEEWLDFAMPRPSLWYTNGVAAPRSSLDQAVAELLLAHWEAHGVQTVAGWVPSTTLTTLRKHRQGADRVSPAIWMELQRSLTVTHDKDRKLVLVRPRELLASERERIEPSVWSSFASGRFTFARWGATLAQSPIGVESNASAQVVQSTLQALEPRAPTWTALTFAAAKSEAWLRVFAWTHPFVASEGPTNRQDIWYIATGDVRTPLSYVGKVVETEAFRDVKAPTRITAFHAASEWILRAAQGAIESDFEVGSIETHEARYRVQALPAKIFGASVRDLGVGTGVIKRMRWEPK